MARKEIPLQPRYNITIHSLYPNLLLDLFNLQPFHYYYHLTYLYWFYKQYEEVIDQEGRSKEMYFGHRAVYKVKRRNVQVFRKTQLHCVNFFKIVDLWCSSYSYYLEYIQIN